MGLKKKGILKLTFEDQGGGLRPTELYDSAVAYAAMANGGKLMTPQIIQQVTDESGAVKEAFPPLLVRRLGKCG